LNRNKQIICYFVSKRTAKDKGAFPICIKRGNKEATKEGNASFKVHHGTISRQKMNILQVPSWVPLQGSITSAAKYKQKGAPTKPKKK
jgi:hypothetical protein